MIDPTKSVVGATFQRLRTLYPGTGHGAVTVQTALGIVALLDGVITADHTFEYDPKEEDPAFVAMLFMHTGLVRFGGLQREYDVQQEHSAIFAKNVTGLLYPQVDAELVSLLVHRVDRKVFLAPATYTNIGMAAKVADVPLFVNSARRLAEAMPIARSFMSKDNHHEKWKTANLMNDRLKGLTDALAIAELSHEPLR